MSWLLFGVYEIGYTIEDPFQGTLRLSILCDGIRRDVLGYDLNRDTAFQLNEPDSATSSSSASSSGSSTMSIGSSISVEDDFEENEVADEDTEDVTLLASSSSNPAPLGGAITTEVNGHAFE